MSAVGYINVSLEIWGCILSVTLALCIRIGKYQRDQVNDWFMRLLICNAVILLSDASAWLFKGHLNTLCYYGVRLANFMTFSLSFILLMMFTGYLTAYLGRKTRVSLAPLRIIQVMSVASVIFLILSQFTGMFYFIDENNIYHRGDQFWVSQIAGIVGMCLNGGLILRYRRQFERIELLAFSSYIVLPVLAMIIQVFIYGIALLNLSTTLSLIIVFLFVQSEQARRIKDQELKLADARVATMLSQIQPHFLYNALTAIKYLCSTQPKVAEEAIVEFSIYLRGNLDALTTKRLIPLEKEIEQVKNYLSLEKKRFGDRINVVWDIQAGGFLLPPLTVQAMVENGVRHGITKREKGGTVVITVKEALEAYYIVISDDGVGIDPSRQPDGRSHVGIENVRMRLETMCCGRLDLESRPGEGTTVTIQIPKESLDPVQNMERTGGGLDETDCGGR